MQDTIDFCDNSPDSIWETIVAMVDDNRSPGRNMDSIYREGYSYLRRWRSSTRSELVALKRDYPFLCPAHMLYCNQRSEKWIVEAGLLTSIPDKVIASYVSQPVEVIEKYATLFFNVKDKLESRGYILSRVLVPAARRGISERDHDLMYKTIAYCLGWDTFTEFIDYKQLSEESRNKLNIGFKDNLLKLGYVATQRLEVNNYNANLVIDSCIRLSEIERNARMNMLQGGTVVTLLGDLLSKCKAVVAAPHDVFELDEPRAESIINNTKMLEYGKTVPLGSDKDEEAN